MGIPQFISDSTRRLRERLEAIEQAGASITAAGVQSEFVPLLRMLDQELRRMRADVVRFLGVAGNPGPLPDVDQALQDQDAPCHCCHCTDRRRRQQEEYSLAAAFYGLPHQF